MKTQHTAGPWEIVRDYKGKPLSYGGNLKVCNLRKPEYIMVNDSGDKTKLLANARLISAAPELLEELKWATSFAEKSQDQYPALQNPKFNEHLMFCRAAISKATGEKP